MKIVCIFIIMTSSYLFGTYLSQIYRYRENDLCKMTDHLNEFLRQITVYRKELSPALKISFGYENKEGIINSVNCKKAFIYLNDAERKTAIEFLKECGKSSSDFEQRKTEECIRKFREYSDEAKRDRKSKNKLCKTICICLGMAVSVMII